MLQEYLYLDCHDESTRKRRNCVGEHLRDVCSDCFTNRRLVFEKGIDVVVDCRELFSRPDGSQYSVSAFALLESCLSLQPSKRCSARDALDSEFLKVNTTLSHAGPGLVGQGQSGVVFCARFGNDLVVCKRVMWGSKQVREGSDLELRMLKILSGIVGLPVLMKVVHFKCRQVHCSVRRSLTSQLRRPEINDYQSLFMSTVVGGKSRFMPLLHVTQVKTLFRCLFAALDKLHNLGICHNDVKHGNIVFNSSSSEFLLIDFSHSFFTSEKNVLVEPITSLRLRQFCVANTCLEQRVIFTRLG